MSIFSIIKNQLVQNELAGNSKGVLELQNFSTNVLKWFEDNRICQFKSLKPKRIEFEGKEGKYFRYQIEFYNVDSENNFFRGTSIRKDTEEDLKNDRMSRGTHSSSDMLTDHYYEDKTLYEHIDFKDTVASDFIVAEAGFDNYEDWQQHIQEQELEEMERLALKEFYSTRIAPDYEYEDELERV